MCSSRTGRIALRGLTVLLLLAASAVAKEKQTVTVSYVVGPARPLPEGLRAIAVINSGVSTQGVQQDEREAKWSVMAADMIEAMLQAGSSMIGSPLAVAKRSETQAVLREHDLALAGMVAGDQAAAAAKLLAVQGLITSRITIQIDEQRGTKSTIDWMSIMGGTMQQMSRSHEPPPPPPPGRPPVVGRRPTQEVRRGPDGRTYVVQREPRYRGNPVAVYDPRLRGRGAVHEEKQTFAGGGISFATKEVEEISRHLTVQCSFTLIDAATGQALVQFSPPPMQKHDRKSPDFLFGSTVGEADLDPVDHFIGELVEQSTREFVSTIVPAQVNATYELVAHHSVAEDGLLALRADDYGRAMSLFEKNLQKHDDDHEAMFAMGVTSELMGKPDQALQWYRRALSTEDVDEEEQQLYASAKDRLTAHIGRILPPAPPGGMPMQQPTPVGQPVPPAAQQQPVGAAPAPQPVAPPAPIIEESTGNQQ